MTLFSLLLYICAIALTIVIAVVASPRIWRDILRIPMISGVTLISILLSSASLIISTQRPSGTGTQTSYGYPKPFYFTWVSWEQPISQQGFSTLYFIGNTLGYASTLAFLLLLYFLGRHLMSRERAQA